MCDQGNVTNTLAKLRDSAATAKAKVKYILATDGVDFEAEDWVFVNSHTKKPIKTAK